MKSHEYSFTLHEVSDLLASVIVPAIIIAVLLRFSTVTGLAPAPWPASDLEHTVLTRQVLATRALQGVDTLLIGDSSCLMNVSADLLAGSGGVNRAENLGAFMYVGFDGFAKLLSESRDASQTIRKVIVLAHPEMLRGVEPVPHYQEFINALYSGQDYGDRTTVVGQLRGVLGLDILQGRILNRLPMPLPREYGSFYGFNRNLYSYMQAHNGSAVDPHAYRHGSSKGNAEYRFSANLNLGCKTLRAAVPPGAQLLVGLTPIPQSFAPANYRRDAADILQQFSQALAADVVLTNLPFIMEDSAFASTTHLNAKGARLFTESIAAALTKP